MMRKVGYLIILLWISLSGIVFASPPGRIVSLAPSVTEILYDLGLGDENAPGYHRLTTANLFLTNKCASVTD